MAAAVTTIAQFESGHGDMVHDATFDYYARRLATCSSDRVIKVFDVVGDQASGGATVLGQLKVGWLQVGLTVIVMHDCAAGHTLGRPSRT
jgi:hypothetical protein